MSVLARARVVLEGDASQLNAVFTATERRMLNVGKRMREIGGQLTTRVTLPIVAMGVGVTKAFADFDDAMQQSVAIMNGITPQIRAEMERTAKDVAQSTTFGARAAAESFFFLASAGLDAQQSIASMPAVARFAQAGMFDMARATDLATDAQSALGLRVNDAQQNMRNLVRVTDVLVQANNIANATVEQFSTSLTREAGAALKSFSIDVEEGVAVLAAFADQGVKGEIAGSGLSRILRLMTQAANNNKKEMQALGLEVFDSEGKIRNLADIIENLERALDGMSDQQRTAALESIGFTARVQGIILPLLGTSARIREYEAALRSAAGTTQEVADKQLQSFTAQLKLAWNQIVLAAIAIGESIEPELRALADTLRNVARVIEDLNPTVKRTIVLIAGLAAALGPLLILLGALATVLTVIKVGALLTGFTGLGVALAAGGVLAVGLGFIVAKFVEMRLEIARVQRATEAATETVNTFLRTLSPEAAQRATARLTGLIVQQEAEYKRLTGEIEKLQEKQADTPRQAARTREAIQALLDQRDAVRETILQWRDQIMVLQRSAIAQRTVSTEAEAATEGVQGQAAWIGAAKEITDALTDSLRQTAQMETILGDEFDEVAARAELYEDAITKLIETQALIDPETDRVREQFRDLVNTFLDLRNGIKTTEKDLEAYNAQMSLARQAVEAAITPTERFNQIISALQEAVALGVITWERYVAAVKQAKETMEGAKTTSDQLKQGIVDAASRGIDAFVEFAFTGKASFMDFVLSALAELTKLILKIELLKLVSGALGIEPVPLAHGGFLEPGELGLVGEQGPELITAGRQGVRVTPAPAAAAMGGVEVGGNVTVNVNVAAVDSRDVARFFEENEGLVANAIMRAQQRSNALQRQLGVRR